MRETLREYKSKLSPKVIAKFKKGLVTVYQSFCYKIMAKSPLRYKLTKTIFFLGPKIAKHGELGKECFEKA